MNKLFRNPKKVVYAIVAFVLLFLLLLSRDAYGDSEVNLQAGYAALRGETPVIGVNLRWPEAGPGRTDWEAGLLLSGESTHYQYNPNTVSLYGMLVPNWGPFELGLGVAYHNNAWEYSCQETFALMAGLRWERVTLRWMHFSSAGSCKPNAGRDIPMVGLRLGWKF